MWTASAYWTPLFNYSTFGAKRIVEIFWSDVYVISIFGNHGL